jgi:histidyl-tRNA synthetase
VLELLPAQQIAFQRMLDVIRRGFERFGFVPLETPVFELAEILLTKTGGDNEKQVYFVQPSGVLGATRLDSPGVDDPPGRCPELALRFDLTVPMARYVAQHESLLQFPFRRYQIQRVYRGERNQRGRYREFYQCDVDVVGRGHLPASYDAEMPAVVCDVLGAVRREFGLGAFSVRISNRRLARGLLAAHGVADEHHAAVLREIDRLDRDARTRVEARLSDGGLGLDPARTTRLLDLVLAPGKTARAALAALRATGPSWGPLADGVDDLERVYDGALALGVPEDALRVDPTVVRGLDYYTGTVYETSLLEDPRLGSICSGGRYDDLASHYTTSRLPGVGISIGATRLFSSLMEAGLVDGARPSVTHAAVLAVDPSTRDECGRIAAELRFAGLNVETYSFEEKMGRQLRHADRTGVPVAVLCGTRERDRGVVRVRDLRPGPDPRERDVPRVDLVSEVRRLVEEPR